MKKTKFNFQIVKYVSETDSIIRAICSHNEGKVPLCLDDFISYAQFMRAIYPALNDGFCIEKGEDGELKASKDGGETWFMIIQEVELFELEPKEEKESVL